MSLIKSNFPSWPSLTDFFDDGWINASFKNEDWMPAINVVENESNYEVEVAAPGMKKEDFEVSINSGVLTVKGEFKKEEEEKEKNYTRKEFSYRSFTKSFTLPEDADEETIEAKYKDGILRLVMMKTEKALPLKKEVVIK